MMKTGTMLVMALFALTSFPLLAQQSPSYSPSYGPSTSPSTSPGAQQTSPGAAQPGSVPESQPTSPSGAPSSPSSPSSPSASPQTSAGPETSAVPTAPPVEMRPVKAELVSKLDTKTAKTGDEIIVQTKAPVKTAAGTEIPKGSKLVGHVIAVQPSAAGKNSQVALLFDQAQLNGGQSVAIQSEIKSISPAGGDTSASGSAGMAGAPMQPSASPSGGSAAGGGAGNASGAMGSAPTSPGYAPGSAQSAPGADAATGQFAEGAIVARNGKIAIHRTSVPGVLLANNAPGEQDPRMVQASGILLGAQDVQLDSGTQMVINVAATGAGSK